MLRMRLAVVTLAIVACSTLLALALPAHAGGIIGGRLGVSVASIDTDAEDVFDTENQTGFAGTAFWQMGSGNLAFQPEVSYIEKGAKSALSDTSLTISYAEVAALVKLGIPIGGLTPHLIGGLGADFRISDDSDFDIETKSVDPNLIIGADIMFTVGSLYIVGDGRYAMGLSSVNEADDVFGDLKNRAWLFSAGVGFKL